MTDQAVISPVNAQAEGSGAKLVYILYLVGLATIVTLPIGLIMAYVNKASAPAWVQTHYRYQIRTFWIAVLYGVIGAVTAFIGVGILITFFLLVWEIVRCVKGLKRISLGQPIENPGTWLW